MRVMCIKKKHWAEITPFGHKFDADPAPEYGDVLEVAETKEWKGGLFYRFNEYVNTFFNAASFIPLDGPDETELLAERGISEERIIDMIDYAFRILNNNQHE